MNFCMDLEFTLNYRVRFPPVVTQLKYALKYHAEHVA